MPTGGRVVAGQATISQSGSAMQIQQASSRAALDWQSFSIGSGASVTFTQPSASAIALNRVLGSDPSAIYGRLSANGQVFLTNPNGILFGRGAQVDVGGLLASTLGMQVDDFMAGRYVLRGDASAGSVVNQGTLRALPRGYVALVAPAVTNEGSIDAPSGTAVMAGTSAATVSFLADGLVQVRVDEGALDAQIANQGAIRADGGAVLLTARALDSLGRAVVNNTGIVEARGVENVNGVIRLSGDVVIHTGTAGADGASGGSIEVQARNVLSAGRLNADGSAGPGGSVSIEASGRILHTAAAHLSADSTAGDGGTVTLQARERVFSSGTLTATGSAKGGTIKVLADEIVLLAAQLDAAGDTGGGTVLAGGDFQGRNPEVRNATSTGINFSTTIKADARALGDGGKVIVWSDEKTDFYGTISARGGARSGDGGFIEVSGKEKLVFGGMADAGAPNGKPGTLLLDPKFIVIDSASAGGLSSFLLADPNPGFGDQFAQQVAVLSNDNVVATDPFDDFAASDAGAVYLFNSTTGALISTLTGSQANDSVGSGGATVLTNGNFVVRSPLWNNGAATSAGAVTFGNGASGISGAVSSTNSLVGTTTGDTVGSNGVTALTNGNYVVSSPQWNNGATASVGAVTFGNSVTGIAGAVSTSNSLHGTTAGDTIGAGGVTALTNGNYAVSSPNWHNGSPNTFVGAVTFGSGTAGVSGAVTTTNSLHGTQTFDRVGSGGVTALTNGNYVVSSPQWANAGMPGAGAVTFGNGTTGVTGAVSVANSLVGSTANDRVGQGSFACCQVTSGVTALTNGNYVVSSINWDNAGVVDAGAVTFGNGATGVTGVVSAANSLVGSTASDFVGQFGVTALANGNYVVSSPFWDNGAVANVGAVTFGNGTSGVSGAVSTGNSLHGTTFNDRIGNSGVTALSNGNYVVSSPSWNNGAATGAGAATFGNGTTGISGAVSGANSLVGTTAGDCVACDGVVALTSGNYVVSSRFWNNGAATSAGAATFGNGTTGVSGAVSITNSLVGTTANDNVGQFITALANGNYVVGSPAWNNGAVTDAGAVTFGNGTTGISGAVSTANSLVGTTAFDQVGSGAFAGVTALANGNYVVRSLFWNNGAVTDAGAATFGSGTTGISGTISTSNSLVGTTANDQIGSGGVAGLSSGSFVVRSPLADSFDKGRVHVVSPGGGGFTNPLTFTDSAAGTITLAPAAITAITNTGSNVVLQANTDITLAVASDIITNNTGGNGGALTLQAGRSILLNSSIITDNGALTLVANETTASGVVDAQRDPGAGGITMAAGTTLNAGSGTVALTVGAGVPGAASGNLVVENVTAANVNLQQNGRTSGSSILRASASSLITATNLLMEVDFGGLASGGSVGTAAAPMRVAATNLESHTHEASPGIFIDSPSQGLTIGGVPFFGGSVKGVQNVTSGDISITANGNLTTLAGTAGCGFTGGTGGPICTGGSTITLNANDMSIGNIVNAGTGTVALAPLATNVDVKIGGTGGLNLSTAELQQITAGVVDIGRTTDTGTLSVDTAITSTNLNAGLLGLKHQNVSINQAVDFSAGNETLGLLHGTGSITIGANVSVGTGQISATGQTVNFTGSPTLTSSNAGTGFSAGTLNIDSADSVSLNATSSVGTLNLSSGTLQGTGAVTVNTAMNWSGGTITGAGLLTTNAATTITNAPLLNGKTWDNANTLTLAAGPGNQLQLANNAVFNNQAGATVLIDSSNGNPFVHNSGGTAHQLNNAGLIRKTNAGTQTLLNLGTYTQAAGATLDVDAGALSLTLNNTYSGTLNVDAGATVLFPSGSHTLNSGLNLTGTGNLTLNGGATLTLGGPFTFGAANPLFAMSAGTLTSASAFTMNQAFAWSGGTITGAGLLTTNAATTITNAPLLNGKTWDNANTLTLAAGPGNQLQLANNAVFNNQAGATVLIDSSNGNPFVHNSGGTAHQLNNAGLIRKTNAGTQTLLNTGTVTNASTGIIQVDAGTLAVTGFPPNSGTLNIASGATLSTNGNSLANSAGGVIGGSGTVNLTSATLTNNGAISPGTSTGILTITGNLTQGASGVINIELAGTGGVAGTDSDRLVVSGTATLDGTLNVNKIGAYVPASGDKFDQVILAGTLAGTFGSVTNNFGGSVVANYVSGSGFNPLWLEVTSAPTTGQAAASAPSDPGYGAAVNTATTGGTASPPSVSYGSLAGPLVSPAPLLTVPANALLIPDFGALLAEMSAKRDRKRNALAKAVRMLEQDPTIADLPACAGAAGGDCIVVRSDPTPAGERTLQAPKLAHLPAIERKVALLIGVADYADPIPSLESPVKDVEEIGRIYREQLGYEVRILANADKAAMVRELNRLILETGRSDSVTVMYAGHGYVVERTQRGYWIPAKASADDPKQWISNTDIGKVLENIPAKQVLLVSDSCYSGTLAREARIERAEVLPDPAAVLERRSVTVLSSGGDEPVPDQGKEGHSVFAWHFMRQLREVREVTLGVNLHQQVAERVQADIPQQPQYGAGLSSGHQRGADYLFEVRRYE